MRFPVKVKDAISAVNNKKNYYIGVGSYGLSGLLNLHFAHLTQKIYMIRFWASAGTYTSQVLITIPSCYVDNSEAAAS